MASDEALSGNGQEASATAAPLTGGSPVGVVFCLLSMVCVQWGAALSEPLMQEIGSFGTTWLRLSCAALFLLLVVRPPVGTYKVRHWFSAAALGSAMALMTLCFFASIEYLPLSLAVAIDFLGPLTVAAVYGRRIWRILCPAIAAAGVLCLAWNGEAWTANTTGVLLAFGAAFGWGSYIILMKRVGQGFTGFEGLALSLLFAAVAATPLGVSESLGRLSTEHVVEVAKLAIMVPLLPYALEYVALRRMKTFAFGILMSLEPAVGAGVGLLVLGQVLTPVQIFGVALVVCASILGHRRRS